MAYMQLGAVDPSNFNCTKYPGICKPSNSATLAIFKNLQAQLNRIAQAIGATKVSVDGDIGNDVLALITKVSANLSQGGVSVDPARNILIQAGNYSSADAAANADTLANAAQGVADQMNVPPKITQPSSGSSTLVASNGSETKISTPTPAAASILDSLGGLSTTDMVLLAAGVGAVVYFTGGKKGGKRASGRSSARHRSRSRRSSRRRR